MSNFLNQNSKPTRLLVRSDTVANWSSTESTPLMFGEIGLGFTPSGKVIAKVGSIQNQQGQAWLDAPQIGAEQDELGINLENIGRVYSSVVVDGNNKPISTFSKEFFYPNCSNRIEYLYGDFSTLPYSLSCGTDGTRPTSEKFEYGVLLETPQNYIQTVFLSGWSETFSTTPTLDYPPILEAPVGFVHPEFDNVIPCPEDGKLIGKLPIQPIQTPISVLSWLENVELWTIPISIKENRINTAMQYLGTVSGWFPFPYRQFVCEGDGIIETTEGIQATLDCEINLNPPVFPNTDTPVESLPTSEAGQGFFTVSAQDPLFTCAIFPEYCARLGVCGTCNDFTATVIQGANWFTLGEIEEISCEPSEKKINYNYAKNGSFDASERTAIVRISYFKSETEIGFPKSEVFADFTFTQPAPDCGLINVLPAGRTFSASASSEVGFTVRTQKSTCSWEATRVDSGDTWITIVNSTGGFNSFANQFGVSVNANNVGGETPLRTGFVRVTEQESGDFIDVRITQAGNTCVVEDITPSSNSISCTSDSSSFNVGFDTLDQTCPWTASVFSVEGNTLGNWVNITGNASGTGDGTISYSASQNVSLYERQVNIQVLEEKHTVSQEPRPCSIVSIIDEVTKTNFGIQVPCGFSLCPQDRQRKFQVVPYSCGPAQGCLEDEVCSWGVDLNEVPSGITVISVSNNIDTSGAPESIIEGTGWVTLSILGPVSCALGEVNIPIVPIGPVDLTGNTCQPQNAFYRIPLLTEATYDVCELCASTFPEDCPSKCPNPIPPFGCQNPMGFFSPNWEQIYTGSDDSFEVIYKAPDGLIEFGDFTLAEVNVFKLANTFVKIKGYLNPGVAPLWDSEINTWVPKYVPNFYESELNEKDGLVFWNMSTKQWEITNIIDGGGAFNSFEEEES